MVQTAASDLPLAAYIHSATLDYPSALAIATSLAEQLAAAHSSGRAHGQLTTQSVFVTRSAGQLRVILPDFDIQQSPPLSGDASSADDVLAFGTLLAEMLAGLQRTGHPLPDWQSAIRQCCNPDPEQRPSMLQAMRLLEASASEETRSVSSSGRPAQGLPARWGPFQLLQRLGHGSFGEVYRAWDPVLEREVALKLLLPRGLDPEQQYAELLAEARAVARVRHPNIVSVYGVDRHDGRVGFWSDFVRGRTLSRIVDASGPLSPEQTAAIGISLCEALTAVHDAGLLHRDIKASNAMRDENGRVLLMDFGLSQELGSVGELAGTPPYMAPELLADRPPSVLSDIYAMGVLLRYLCTGTLPGMFVDPAGEPPPPIPAPLDRVIQKATSADPQQRYLSASRLREALASAQTQIAVPAPVVASLLPRRTRLLLWAVGGLLFLVVASYIVYPLYIQRRQALATGANSPAAFQDYQAAEKALYRYDRPGNTQKAISLFQDTLRIQPSFALAEAGLAQADWHMYQQTGDKKWAGEASDAAAAAARLNPGLAAVQMTLGSLHVAQGQFNLGMQELDQAQQDDPMSAEVHGALAEAYRQEGRLDDAKHEFQTAIDLEPDNWLWPYQLGALQIDAGEFPQAESNLKIALSKSPDNSHVLYDLGLVYKKQGLMPEAENVFAQSLHLVPSKTTMMALGGAYLLQGDVAKAVPLYQRAVRLDPSDWNAWGNLAATEQWSGSDAKQVRRDFERAVALARPQLAITPDDAFLIYRLAFFYANLHDAAQALPLLRKSLFVAPNDPDSIESNAESYELLGDREQALSLIGKALQLRFSADYVRKVPDLQALREDPRAPQEIRVTPTSSSKGK